MRGFQAYQRNTGQRHKLQPDVAVDSENSKRAVGKDALVDDSEELWHGKFSFTSR